MQLSIFKYKIENFKTIEKIYKLTENLGEGLEFVWYKI